MSSILGSVGLNESGGWENYRASKAALNTLARSFEIRHRDEGFGVALIHPGWVRTEMGGPEADIDVATSVAGMADVIEGQLGQTGCVYLDYTARRSPGRAILSHAPAPSSPALSAAGRRAAAALDDDRRARAALDDDRARRPVRASGAEDALRLPLGLGLGPPRPRGGGPLERQADQPGGDLDLLLDVVGEVLGGGHGLGDRRRLAAHANRRKILERSSGSSSRRGSRSA